MKDTGQMNVLENRGFIRRILSVAALCLVSLAISGDNGEKGVDIYEELNNPALYPPPRKWKGTLPVPQKESIPVEKNETEELDQPEDVLPHRNTQPEENNQLETSLA